MSQARRIALAVASAGALVAASAAVAQEKKAEPGARHGEHARGEHRGHGMGGMAGMRAGCHGAQAQAEGGEHKHQ